MRFFNFDLHISVIEDVKHIFKALGHEVDSCCISGHHFVFNNKTEPLDIVNQYNWQQLTPEMCDAFYERYKDEFKDYDGFIVTYPPAFSLLFEKFNKPIIIYAPIRYETPFTKNPTLLKWFNDFLKRGIDSKQIILVANSVYEQKYCEFFLDRPCSYITNWCDYGDTYPKWTGTDPRFLLFNDSNIKIESSRIQDRHTLQKPYKWETIEAYKGIIHIPYNISTMSTYEQYTANTPLFFPSQSFLLEMMQGDTNVLCGLTWNQYHNLPPAEGDNPNNYKDINVLKKWLPLAEYYNQESMPYITYFDSFNHFVEMIKNEQVDFADISDKMKAHNIVKKHKIHNDWKELLDKI